MTLQVRHDASFSAKDPGIETIVNRLSQQPWCAKLLSQPGLVIGRPRAYRDGERKGREDSLTATTLNVGDGVSTLLYFYQRPGDGKLEGNRDEKRMIEEISALIVVGEGMNGFPGTLHGGMVATLLDEIMGIWVNVNWRRGLTRAAWMTALLKTTFLRPVITPLTVLAVTKLVKLEGRKLNLEARLEDEKGEVLARAEGLFIGTKPRL
jgi:uncharacterized protein (TIGR00369 family)